MSDSFMTINGVRQGKILSPLFFNIYVNEISEKLNSKIIGCSFKGMRINHLMYNMFVSKSICSLPEIHEISCYSLLQRINTSDNALVVS